MASRSAASRKTHFTHEWITIGPAFDARKPFRNFHFIVSVSLLILRVLALRPFSSFVFPFWHCHSMVIMRYSLFILPNHVYRAAAERKSSLTFLRLVPEEVPFLWLWLQKMEARAISSPELLKNPSRTITGDTITFAGRF